MHVSKHILDYRKKINGNLANQWKNNLQTMTSWSTSQWPFSKNCPGPPYPLIRLRAMHVIVPKACYLPWSIPTWIKAYTKSVSSFQMKQVVRSHYTLRHVRSSFQVQSVTTLAKSLRWPYGSRGAMQVRSLSRILCLNLAFEVRRDGFSFSRLVISLSLLWSDMLVISRTNLLKVSIPYAQRFIVSFRPCP